MWSGSTGLLEYQADQQTAKVSNFEDNFGIELLIRAAAEPQARALIRKEQPPGCRDLYVWPKRRIFEPSTCPSGHDDNNMWVIDKFEESCFHTTPSCFFLSSFTHHAHLARDVSLVFQITSTGKQPGITSRPQVTFAMPSRHLPFHMSRSLLLEVASIWHPRKCKRCSSQRPLSPVSQLTPKVCLSLCAFTLGETLREFSKLAGCCGTSQGCVRLRLTSRDIYFRQSLASQRHIDPYKSSHLSTQTLPLPLNSYSPRQGRLLINNLLQ